MLSLEKENWDSLTRLERCVKNGRYKHGDKKLCEDIQVLLDIMEGLIRLDDANRKDIGVYTSRFADAHILLNDECNHWFEKWAATYHELNKANDKVDELNKKLEKAYTKANNYLYFDDSSDYGVALWEVIRVLKPELAEKWDNNEEYPELKYIEEIEE